MLTTTVMAVRATPKALELLKAEENYRRIDRENGIPEEIAPEKISYIDTIKICWKCYIPAMVTGTVSMVCLIGASSVNARRNAALATAYSIAETSLKEYQSKVVETIGEKKNRQLEMRLRKKRLTRIQ